MEDILKSTFRFNQFLLLEISPLGKQQHLEDSPTDLMRAKLYPLLPYNSTQQRSKWEPEPSECTSGIQVTPPLSSRAEVLLAVRSIVLQYSFRHVDESDAVVVMYDLTSFASLHTAR